ncbi:outer membrane beta-barrel protein [Thalassotalea psychrophila]|uniref:Outer membrane beta-barrel protein n=1 Tax=Thalassotalea psychrophila TaxID=3065647 RepID=A0ABY9TPN8_9GAMM|nr:outer membrane beta-barrel protein [Colwelliaceae bacterium SQ149]
MHKSLSSCVLLLSFLVTNALAEQPNITPARSYFYLGGLIGSADTKETFQGQLGTPEGEYTQSDQNSAFGFYIGFNFADKWSLESSIVVVGGINERPSSIPIDEVYLTALTVTPVLHINITEQVSIYVKAGLGILLYSEDLHKHGDTYRHSGDDYWASAGLALGAGLQVDVSEQIAFRLGFDAMEADLEADDDNHHQNLADVEEEFSMVSMSFHYKF